MRRPWGPKDADRRIEEDFQAGAASTVAGKRLSDRSALPRARQLPCRAHFDWSGNIACSPPAVRALPGATWKNCRIEMHSLIIPVPCMRARTRAERVALEPRLSPSRLNAVTYRERERAVPCAQIVVGILSLPPAPLCIIVTVRRRPFSY